MPIEVLVDVRLAVVAALERGLGEGLDLAGREPEAAVAGHRLDQRVEDLGDGEDLLLADAEQVVVERRRPSTIDLAALSRQAVASTTTGGLPGPATIARRLLASAARATAGPPVTTSSLMRVVVEELRGRLERRRVDDRDQVVEADRLADRLVEPADALGGDLRRPTGGR